MLLIFVVSMKYSLYRQVEILVLLYKMLYLEQYKLLKMLVIIQKIIIKDMAYVLMKEINLVIQ